MSQTKLELERKEDMEMEINRQRDGFVCQRRYRHPQFQTTNAKKINQFVDRQPPDEMVTNEQS